MTESTQSELAKNVRHHYSMDDGTECGVHYWVGKMLNVTMTANDRFHPTARKVVAFFPDRGLTRPGQNMTEPAVSIEFSDIDNQAHIHYREICENVGELAFILDKATNT